MKKQHNPPAKKKKHRNEDWPEDNWEDQKHGKKYTKWKKK